MHYTMKAVENCCISSCNLLSQRYFNGNLSHFFFQIYFHLLYKMTSAPVLFSLSIPFLGALRFLLITNLIPTGPQLYQLLIPETTQLQKTCTLETWNFDLLLGNSTTLSFIFSPPELACQNAFWLLEAFQLGGSRSPVLSLCVSSTEHLANHFKDVFAIISKSLILFTFNCSSVMNDFQEGFLFSHS